MKIKNKSTKFNLSCCNFKMDGKEYENIDNFVNGELTMTPETEQSYPSSAQSNFNNSPQPVQNSDSVLMDMFLPVVSSEYDDNEITIIEENIPTTPTIKGIQAARIYFFLYSKLPIIDVLY